MASLSRRRFAEESDLFPMPLLPRWRYMTDEAKALARRSAVSALLVLVVVLVFRSLLPWVVLVVVLWWLWRMLSK